jgi:hypothetical protein
MKESTESPTSTVDQDRRRMRVNLACFTVLAVLYTIWFQRHMKGFVTQSLLLGGSLSLLGIWKLLWEAIGVGSGERPDDWIRRLLKGPNVREYLGFAAVLLVLLYALTSSIYLSFEGNAPGQAQFTVQVWDGDRMVMPPIELSSYDRNKGRPFFFRGSTANLEYRIVKPTGYATLERDLEPWGQHNIRVPRDFSMKQLHLLRIVPGAKLLASLPEAPDSPGLRYQLLIRPERGEPVVVQPLVKSLLFSGMSQPELGAAVDPGELDRARRAIDDYFARLEIPPEARESSVSKLIDRRQLIESPEWASGDRLVFEVRRLKAGAPANSSGDPYLERAYTVPSDGTRVHTVVLE